MQISELNPVLELFIFHIQKEKIPNEWPEATNWRRTDNTMTKTKKTKRQTTIDKTLHRKLENEQHDPHKTTGVNSNSVVYCYITWIYLTNKTSVYTVASCLLSTQVYRRGGGGCMVVYYQHKCTGGVVEVVW
jgi:hypothetical protein